MTDEVGNPAADGVPVPGRPAVVYELAVAELMGTPPSDPIGLSAMFLDQCLGVGFHQRRDGSPEPLSQGFPE